MTHGLTSLNGTPNGPLAFGTMQFGGTADEADARAMYEACRDAGVIHFDTAHVYTQGRSEEMLGHLVGAARDEVIVATKAGYTGGAGRENLRAQFDLSRKRLGMDQVDLLYLHRFDPDTDLRETIEAFAELQQQGLIRYIGLSNFAAWQVMKAQMIAAEFGTKIDALQPMYSLVKRQAEVEILPMCADQKIAVFSYSPLGSGLLTGKYTKDGAEGRLASDKRYAARYGLGWMHHTAEDIVKLAADFGTDPATLAVAWAMSHPTAPVPIISARNVDQLRPSLAALKFEMTADMRRRISGISVSPAPATDRIEEA